MTNEEKDQIWKDAERMASELFSASDSEGARMSEAELGIVFSTTSHVEKVAALKALRACAQ
jgi:hypothetical protein